MKALLISTQGIGNTVLVTPATRCLSQKYGSVDMLVCDNGSDAIVRRLPFVERVHCYRQRDSFIKNTMRLAYELKRCRYDSLYIFYPDGRKENIITYAIGGKRRAGIKDRKGYWQLLRFLTPLRIALVAGEHDIISNLKISGAGNTEAVRPIVEVPPEF